MRNKEGNSCLAFVAIVATIIIGMVGYNYYLCVNGYLFRDGIILFKRFAPAHTELTYVSERWVEDYVPNKWYFLLKKL